MKDPSSYDVSKDKKLATFRADGEFGKIEVAKCQYDGGKIKFALSRVRTMRGEDVYMHIGRLTESEVDVLIRLLLEAKR